MGTNYWKDGLVELLESDGSTYIATVHGSMDYTTEVVLDGDTIVSHRCNCPYSGSLCKHKVALLLAIQDQREIEKKLLASHVDIETADSPSANPTEFLINGVRLTERELYVACLIAVCGESAMPRLSLIGFPVGRLFNMTKAERTSILTSLATSGIIYEIRYWSEKDYEVNEPFCYSILKELVSNHDSWLQFFKAAIPIGNREWYLLEIAERCLGKRAKIEHEWRPSKFGLDDKLYIFDVLKQVVLEEDKDIVLSAIKPTALCPVFHMLLDDIIEYGLPEYLTKMATYFDISKRWTDEWHACYQHLRMVSFLATGVLMPMLDGPLSSYSFYTDAVIALYENRLDDSVNAFRSGLNSEKGKKQWQKNIPSNSAIFLLYVIALGRRRNAKDVGTLRKVLEFSDIIEIRWSIPIFTLADFFQSTKQVKQTKSLITLLQSEFYESPCTRVTSAIILAFFKSENMYSGEWPAPTLAFLQREMSAFGMCDKGPWPYEAALVQYQTQEPWQLELQELLMNVSDASEVLSSNPERTNRLAYLVTGSYQSYRIYEIREQWRLKNGAWGKGKMLSYWRYTTSIAGMDEIDKKIHDAWFSKSSKRKYDGELPPLSMLVPYLVGTDKLLLHSGNGILTPLSLREELPFLTTTSNDGMIKFRSNVPKNVMQVDNGVLDAGNDEKWVYFPMSMEAQKVLYRLLEIDTVPVSAEPMLERLFKALKGKLEIHSEIEGAIEIEKIQGQQCMRLRITPEGSVFRAELYLIPLEGGSRSVFPGSGSELVYDSREGKRFEISRNLKQEKAALKILNHLLADIAPELGFSSRMPEIKLTLSELLAVIELGLNNETLFAIEWPEGGKVKVTKSDASKWEISANPVGGWFDLEGDIPLTDNHIVSMSQLLSMFRESNNGYIRLSESEYLRLSDSLSRQLKRIDALSQKQGNKVRVNGIAMAVSESDLQGELDIHEPESLIQMRKRIRESENMEVEIPRNLNATLRDYQEDGVRWMLRMTNWGAGVCLADDMGLGKTLQTLACLLSRKDKGAQMVVAPASVVGNWRREANRFAPSLNVVMLNELAMDSRGDAIAALGSGDLLVLTYGLLVSECDALTEKEWVSVCLDEAHTIKNRDTKSSAAAMRLKSECRIILTGTPIQNHLGELWNLMQFINPGLLGSYDHFNERVIVPINAGMQEARSQLKRLIAPFLLRRTKQEVARELPDKEDITLPVSLSEEELSVYEVIRREAKSELESSSVVNVNALAMITKLREAACSASLVEKGLDIPSSKLSLMIDKLQQIVEQGNKVLVFSQFTSFLEMARKEMMKAGITDYFYLNGSTPVRERQKMVEAFQTGEKRVFLISLKAGGLGLNLTNANYVIHLDPWWNPAIEQQATDRAYRIGQKQKVTVYHLISEHTIEEKILRLHQTKRSLADCLLQGTDTIHKLTAKDLLEMIS